MMIYPLVSRIVGYIHVCRLELTNSKQSKKLAKIMIVTDLLQRTRKNRNKIKS